MKIHVKLQSKRIGCSEPPVLTVMFCIYIMLSFFENYLARFFGSSTKYFLLLMLCLWVYCEHFKIRLNILSSAVLTWFVYKVISIAWSSMENNDVRAHLFSQIGMVLLVTIVTSRVRSRGFLQLILRVNYGCSFLFGVLSIIFRSPYLRESLTSRQVLTLWGQQMDPNNCAAFLGIAVGLGAYSMFCEKKHRVLNAIVVLVNSGAIILTGSRGGFLLAVLLVAGAMLLPNWNMRTIGLDIIKRMAVMIVVAFVGIVLLSRYTDILQDGLARLLAFDNYEGGSERTDLWAIALKHIERHPLFGCGWGGYTIRNGMAIHNTYLTILCDTGMFGLVIFITPIIYTGCYALNKRALSAVLILMISLVPACTLDSINKRYFWNAIIIAIMMVQYIQKTGRYIQIWDDDEAEAEI